MKCLVHQIPFFFSSPIAAVNEYITHLQSTSVVDSGMNSMYMPKAIDNIDIVRQPIHAGYELVLEIDFFYYFLYSFLKSENFERDFRTFKNCVFCLCISFISSCA